jgi:hypothetical protein
LGALVVWHHRVMAMREDCRHFESRTYPGGEVARFCVLDLAPEAPWRCPENCPQYEQTLIDGSFVAGSLTRPDVEDEPDEKPEDIQDLLDDAEMIVDAAEPTALRELGASSARSRKWWQVWKRASSDGPDDDWHLSTR